MYEGSETVDEEDGEMNCVFMSTQTTRCGAQRRFAEQNPVYHLPADVTETWRCLHETI